MKTYTAWQLQAMGEKEFEKAGNEIIRGDARVRTIGKKGK